MSKISSGSLTVVDVKGGSDGINTATIYLYQRATTAPSKPSTNLTYTFATAKLTGGLGSWTQDIGTLTGSDPIWVIAAVASSNGNTDVIELTEWSEPIKMAQNGQDGQDGRDGQDGQPGAPGQPGANGLNQATVFIYKRAQSVTKPSDSEYTFETGSFTITDGWQKTIPAATTENRNPCWVCTAVAIGSESPADLKWNTPSVLVENGSDGVSPVVTSTDNGVQIYDPISGETYTITNGTNGTSYYTHILYSSKATPTSSSDVSTSPTGKDYVGIQTTTSQTVPSWDDSGWQWVKYVGNDGISVTVSSIKYAKSTTDNQPQDSSFNTALPTVGEGEWLWTMTTYSDGSKVYTKSKQGKSGTSVTVSKTEYQAGTSATTAPTGEWKTTIPSVAEGQYLWTKTIYSDGNYSYTVAKQGKSGTSITISSTSVKYQVGTSPTTAPTGEWKDTVQSTTTGQYLWTRTIVTYSDGSETTSYSVSAHGATGDSVSISSIKYATSITDSQPADSSFGTSIPTVSEGQWLWTMTTYSNGSKMYTKSKQGKSGVSVTKTRELYYLKTNSDNVPTITAASQITATDRENGWTSIVPTYVVNGTYYTCIETSLSVGDPVWSTPVVNQGLTDANANAAESLSVSTHANENAQGALSISRATQQHYWFVSENTGSGASLIEAGAYITDTPIDTFKSGKSGGYLLARSDGIILGKGTNRYMELSGSELKFYKAGTTDSTASTASNVAAKLSSTGLEIANGSITLGNYFSVDNTGVLTAKSGTIGGWNFTDAALYYSNATPGYSTTNLVISKSSDVNTNAIAGSETNKHWFLAAGRKFGVDTEGNLYANNAHLSSATVEGAITATQLTISSGGTTYSGVSAINISGYSIEIITDSTGVTDADTTTYLYPHLYHNGIEIEYLLSADITVDNTKTYYTRSGTSPNYTYTAVTNPSGNPSTNQYYEHIDYTKFLWFRDNETIGTAGDANNQGRYLATYGHSYRVIYDFEDGEVGGATEIQTREVDPQKYITRIADNGITVHPEITTTGSNYIHIDGNSLMVKKQVGTIAAVSTDTVLANFGTTVTIGDSSAKNVYIDSSGVQIKDGGTLLANFGTTAQIGQSNSSRFLMNSDSLQAYNSSGTKYFEVNANGLSWGSNTAATITQVNTAAQIASNYITNLTDGGIRIHPVNNENNSIVINSDGMEVFKGGSTSEYSMAFYGETARVGNTEDNHIIMSSTDGIVLKQQSQTLASFNSDEIIIGNPQVWSDNYMVISNESIEMRYNLAYDEYSYVALKRSSGKIEEDIRDQSVTETWSKTLIYEPLRTTQIVFVINRGTAGYYRCYFTAGTASTDENYDISYDGDRTFTYTYTSSEASVDPQYSFYSIEYQTIPLSEEGGYIQVGDRGLGSFNLSNTATFGKELITDSANQVATGRFNLVRNSNGNSLNYAFMIGNGSSGTNRSNALTVDWSGNVDITSGAEYRINGKSITSQPIKIVQYGWVASSALSERTRVIQGANPANSSNSSDEPSSSEYTFVAWITFTTNGWCGAVYPATPMSRTSDLWTATVKAATTGVSIYGTALYVRNDLL